MRHQHGYKKLGRTSAHRRALLRNMATSLFRHESIRTTSAKAKALRSYAEKLVTLGKKGDLSSRRRAAALLFDPAIVQKLFAEIAPRFSQRDGGYVRIMKIGERRGDRSELSVIELVERGDATPALSA